MASLDALLAKPAAGAAAPQARLRTGTLVPRLVTGLVIVVAWETLVRALLPAYVAKPSTVLLAVPKTIVDPAFLAATADTLSAVAQGLGIAVVLGTLIGLVIGRSPLADRMLRHYVNGFYAVPMIVILPLVSLWFGYSEATRLVTIVYAAIFSIIVNVADGARAVPRDYIEVAQAFRSGRLRALFEIVLPSATPYFLAGIRLATGRALIGALVAEFFTAIGGLGYFILYMSRTFRHDEAFVGVALLAAFGIGIDALVAWATRRFLPWYRREERSS
ncbi:MAG TPA: ABC transporter permease [Xanthobacteraceae bacterium]|nr:ABC transporter permease [Xanthobacteraceae bacterium]